jgi:pectinesterase
VLATDGTGDFLTVQEAINAVPDFRKNETRIFIKNGIYKEKLILPGSKTNVVFIGDGFCAGNITFAEYKNTGSGAAVEKRAICSHQLSDDESTL